MATKTDYRPTFKSTDRRESAGRAWLAAKAARDAADKALAEARDALIKALSVEVSPDGSEIAIIAYRDGQMESVSAAVLHVGDQALQVQRQERREFDVDALDDNVSDFVFAQVTEVKVSAPAFDAAVTMGLISEDVVDAVVVPKEVIAVREVKP